MIKKYYNDMVEHHDDLTEAESVYAHICKHCKRAFHCDADTEFK